jgi:glutamate formiminotransferase/formiminotetrahydrofolate cyclodeaminase
MNFTNFNQTPLARVVESIRREAAVYGTSVHSSELVGLIPQKALTDAARWYLQLDHFDNHQILEQRIYDVYDKGENNQDAFKDEFLTQLADRSPTPASGAALAYTGAQAAALLSMVAKSTLHKPSYEKFYGLMQHILVESDATRFELIISMEQDVEVVNQYIDLMRSFPNESFLNAPPTPEILQAISRISHIPLMIAKKCILLMDLAISAAQNGNQNALADAINAFLLAKTAAEGCLLIIRINIKPYHSHPILIPFAEEIQDLTLKISAHQSKMNIVLDDNTLKPSTQNE